MDPATQIPVMVKRAVRALLEDEKSYEPLAELMGMLRRQGAADRNRALLMNLEEAATLPVPRSLLRAKGMSGSILDVGEVSVFSGMGGAGNRRSPWFGNGHGRPGPGQYGTRRRSLPGRGRAGPDGRLRGKGLP